MMGVNISLELGHFDIYKFEFAENLRKEKHTYAYITVDRNLHLKNGCS